MLLRAILFCVPGLLAFLSQLDAQLKVQTPVVKLGEVRGGPSLTQRFPFTNEGAAPLEIVAIDRGCSCLHADLDRRLFGPGQSGVLTLTLRTLGHKNGPYAWNAKIRYRVGDRLGETSCRLEGVIRNEVTLEPSELVLFVTDELKQEVRLTDLRAMPFRIARLETTLPGVKLEIQEEKAGCFRVLLHAEGAAIPYGVRHGRVDIHTTDSMVALLSLPVKLVRSYPKAVRAVPERIRLNPVSGVKTALVRLRSADDKALRIERVAAAGLKCTWAEHPAGGVLLRVTAEGETAPPVVRVVFEGVAKELELPVVVE